MRTGGGGSCRGIGSMYSLRESQNFIRRNIPDDDHHAIVWSVTHAEVSLADPPSSSF